MKTKIERRKNNAASVDVFSSRIAIATQLSINVCLTLSAFGMSQNAIQYVGID